MATRQIYELDRQHGIDECYIYCRLPLPVIDASSYIYVYEMHIWPASLFQFYFVYGFLSTARDGQLLATRGTGVFVCVSMCACVLLCACV